MIPLEQIVEYIKNKYRPLSIILYGSYASGTQSSNSDFDALVISRDHEPFHDTSFVGGIPLDVFVYPAPYFDGAYNCQDFIRIFDGKIIMDSDDRGKALQNEVLTYLQQLPPRSKADILADVDWCAKMLARTGRGDAEGLFRWHWLLTDSLEIFCDIARHQYWGPKKSLRWMKENHPAAFALYETALREFTTESLDCWISLLKTMADTL